MESMINTMSSTLTISPIQTSAFGMSTRGCALGQDLGIQVEAATGRKRLDAVKGHVAFVAYVPGIHAWSPPIC